jgi:hypothetical protein
LQHVGGRFDAVFCLVEGRPVQNGASDAGTPITRLIKRICRSSGTSTPVIDADRLCASAMNAPALAESNTPVLLTAVSFNFV